MTVSLPSNFLQEPVVFFTSGPPSQNFSGGGRPRRFQSGPTAGRNNARNGLSPYHFFRKMAVVILSLYALSMAVRFASFLVESLFSPPVLLLCLITLMASKGWENTRSFFENEVDATEFHRAFCNPRCLHRLFGTSQGARGRNCAAARSSNSTNIHRHNFNGHASSNRSSSNQRTAGGQAQPHGQASEQATAENGFEIVTALNLMAGLPGVRPPEERSSARNTNATEESVPDTEGSTGTTHYQKVPIHREETKDALVISMDISGFDAPEIQISVENSTLYIRGERKNKIGDAFVIEESFALDEEQFVEESIKANISDGVLEVTVEKKPEPAPRVISITTNIKED